MYAARMAVAALFAVASFHFAAPCFCAMDGDAPIVEAEPTSDEHSCCAGMLADEERESEPPAPGCPHCDDGACVDVALDLPDAAVFLAKDSRIVVPPPQQHVAADYAAIVAALRPVSLTPMPGRAPPDIAHDRSSREHNRALALVQVYRL